MLQIHWILQTAKKFFNQLDIKTFEIFIIVTFLDLAVEGGSIACFINLHIEPHRDHVQALRLQL